MSHTTPDATPDHTAGDAIVPHGAPQPVRSAGVSPVLQAAPTSVPTSVPTPVPISVPTESSSGKQRSSGRWRLRARVAWAVTSILVTECVVPGLAVLAAVSLWTWWSDLSAIPEWAQVLAMAMALVPAYIVFALAVALLSAMIVRLYGWQTPSGLNGRLADMSWPVLNWGDI